MGCQYIIENIRHIIEEKGLKKTYVARASGMNSQQFADLLAGRKVFRVEYLAPLAEALGCTINDIVKGA